MTGFEPATSASRTQESPTVNSANKELTDTPPPVCTTVCTSKPDTEHEDAIGRLASAIRELSAEDREKLVTIMMGEQDDRDSR